MFPNLKDVHVSEATYYRLYMDDYLPDNLSSIVYLDADVVCVEREGGRRTRRVEMSGNVCRVGISISCVCPFFAISVIP